MTKKEIYKTIIGFMICLFTAFMLIVIYLPAEKYKTKKLAEEITVLLNKQGKDSYRAEEAIPVESPVQSGILVFNLKDASDKAAGFVFLVRITGICGPVPALFICDTRKNIEFIGSFFEKNCLTDMQIAYWISYLRSFSESIEK